MLRWNVVAVMLAALLCAWPVQAGLPETPRPRQLTVADGLPSNRVNGIAQDRQGYLWIATSDGLARFDGVGFRVWRMEQGLRDNFVWAVHVDPQDRVWFGTRSAGLGMLDAGRTRIGWIDREGQGIGSNEVWSITTASDGALWFGTADAGLYRLQGRRIDRHMPVAGNPRTLPDPGIRRLLNAPDGSLWVGTGNGVARWTGRDFERLPQEALASPYINGLTIERDGTLWIGTPRGVGRRTPDGRTTPEPWGARNASILNVLLHDRGDTYWFDIPEGLGVDTEDGIAVVPLYSELAHGLVRPSWVDAFEDREGALWFASNTSGLWHLPSRWRQFSVLSRRLDDPTSLANANVRGIAPSADGSMWLVGSGGVLDRFDSETGRVEHVVDDVGDGFILMGALEDRRGIVWVAFVEGLARIEPGTGRIRRWFSGGPDGALPGDTASLVEAEDGAIWMAGEGGVQARDGDGRIIRTVVPGDRHGLPAGTVVTQVAYVAGQGVWLSTSRGLYAWREAAGRFERVSAAGDAPVHGAATDARGGIWLARPGMVERYTAESGQLRLGQRLGREAGFPAIAPSGLTVDMHGIVWVTTLRGLVRVDPQARSSRVYGVRDGLPSQEFAGPPVARPADGRILAGTPDGLVVFDPAVVRPESRPPGLLIETVDVSGEDGRRELDPGAPFTIGPGDRDLRVRARLMSFGDPAAHDYRFRLDGYDRGWVRAGHDAERVFSQLPPGDYRLQVIARTADQVWSEPREVRFTVLPPWWRTWWAIGAAVLLVLATLALAARIYRDRLRRRLAWQRAEHERRLAEEASLAKTRFLATFGHEVRTPMTGVLGMTELLLDTPLDARQRSYVEAVRSAGGHLLRLLNDALDLARVESGRLELACEPFDLRAMLADVAALAGPLARGRGLDFELEIDADVPAGVRGDASRLRQILLNLLGNAQKFTERGHIALRVRRAGCDIRFTVEDTGPGLGPEHQVRLFRPFEQAGAQTAARHGGSGLGLAISQELAQAMGGRIDLDSTPGEGSRFHVEVPLEACELPAEATARPAGKAVVDRPLSLLLVEDDPTVAEVVSGLLQAQGHRVRHAPHGLAALTDVAVADFDAALLDLDLPGMDGLALARQLRRQGFAAPLVAITARADADSEPQAMAAGFDAFVRKPVTARMLAEALGAVMAGEAAV